MVYVLLLRGVNVGGKNKVSMSDLKEALSNEGFEDVSSYINSGNLFFRSTQGLEHCSSVIAHILTRDYAFPIPFVLMPDWWQGDLARRDVLFIPNNTDKASILDFINTSELYNEIVYIGQHSIFWGKYDEAEYLKSTYHKKLIKQDFYKHITIRNGKTYDKVADILQEKG